MSSSSGSVAPIYVGDGTYWDPKFELVNEEQYRKDHPLNTDYQQNEGHPDPDPPRKRDENLFTQYGYEWLGPGTDVEWNMQHNVQPVDALDAAAKQHDLEYYSIKKALDYGELTYDQAVRAVSAADRRLGIAASKVDQGVAVMWGMNLKQAWDNYWGYPSWAGIDRAEFNTATRPEPAGASDWRKNPDKYPTLNPGTDYFWQWHSRFGEWVLVPYQEWEQLPSYLRPPNYSGVPHDPSGGGSWWPSFDNIPNYSGTPLYNWGANSGAGDGFVAPISVSEDRNRNGIPDVLEKRRRKRRRHFNFSRN